MYVLALVTQKGGSGKSTLAVGLAVAAIENGERVAFLEADPQGTISKWNATIPIHASIRSPTPPNWSGRYRAWKTRALTSDPGSDSETFRTEKSRRWSN